MNAKNIFLAGLLLSCACPVFSQEKVPAGTYSSTAATGEKAAKGTYQFIIPVSKVQPVFSEEILIDVEKNRDENEIKYMQLEHNVKVKILPRKTITAADFKPLEEIVYVEQ